MAGLVLIWIAALHYDATLRVPVRSCNLGRTASAVAAWTSSQAAGGEL